MILSGGDHKVTLAYLERARVYIFLALGKDPSKESKIEEKSEYSAAVVKMKEQNIICNYEMASIPGSGWVRVLLGGEMEWCSDTRNTQGRTTTRSSSDIIPKMQRRYRGSDI
mmetsp:Transcript_14231/g.35960  ORF Transcript_14231/g.35960 Transcript_14231/m.35960 type:complete len:112 (-) Transcript_14231:217-552(-)